MRPSLRTSAQGKTFPMKASAPSSPPPAWPTWPSPTGVQDRKGFATCDQPPCSREVTRTGLGARRGALCNFCLSSLEWTGGLWFGLNFPRLFPLFPPSSI